MFLLSTLLYWCSIDYDLFWRNLWGFLIENPVMYWNYCLWQCQFVISQPNAIDWVAYIRSYSMCSGYMLSRIFIWISFVDYPLIYVCGNAIFPKQAKMENGNGDKVLSSFVGEIILATKEVNICCLKYLLEMTCVIQRNWKVGLYLMRF